MQEWRVRFKGLKNPKFPETVMTGSALSDGVTDWGASCAYRLCLFCSLKTPSAKGGSTKPTQRPSS